MESRVQRSALGIQEKPALQRKRPLFNSTISKDDTISESARCKKRFMALDRRERSVSWRKGTGLGAGHYPPTWKIKKSMESNNKVVKLIDQGERLRQLLHLIQADSAHEKEKLKLDAFHSPSNLEQTSVHDETSSNVIQPRIRTGSPWTPAEEGRLKQMRDAGHSWSEIAKTFPQRTEGSVKKHWYKDMHYAEFSEDEAEALRQAIQKYDSNKWKVIGQELGKPAKACEQYAKEHFGWGKEEMIR